MQKRYKGLEAKHWHRFNDNRVECDLCPRHCRTKDGRMGFCGVRGNEGNTLHTYNYGLSLPATEETIQTEGVFHYRPGARILSMGNVGCMMSCSFCQNWQTSQTKHLDHSRLVKYTSEDLIEICLENNIEIISWTYDDPVVWHEFVVDTSRLAHQYGIKTLYKSALYIEERPCAELIDCIDIFSISLKSLDDSFYRKHAKAKLQPVLDRIKQVAASGRHLEISQLVIPELNDRSEDIAATVDWIKNNLGIEIPLHFVGFHPAYRYTQVERTAHATLKSARDYALSQGLKYVYLGNTKESESNETLCEQCGAMLIERSGATVHVKNIHENGTCLSCATPSTIVEALHTLQKKEVVKESFGASQTLTFSWTPQVKSIHLERVFCESDTDILYIREAGTDSIRIQSVGKGLDRVSINQSHFNEREIEISWYSENRYRCIPILDRAHFPIVEVVEN